MRWLGPNLRAYGPASYGIAVVHGGPGARGSAAAIARDLAKRGMSVLEPLQTMDTVAGQVDELAACLDEHAAAESVVVGHSWGAWLGALLAAQRPDLVRKLVLVGCAPFEDQYAASIRETRLAHLTPEERDEMLGLQSATDLSARLIALTFKADTYAADPDLVEHSDFDAGIYERVWPEAAAMRRDGRLLESAARISCPVIALHGSYDPHPADGVREPLERVLADFRLIELERCGHEPWIEQFAREPFYRALFAELSSRSSSVSASP